MENILPSKKNKYNLIYIYNFFFQDYIEAQTDLVLHAPDLRDAGITGSYILKFKFL